MRTDILSSSSQAAAAAAYGTSASATNKTSKGSTNGLNNDSTTGNRAADDAKAAAAAKAAKLASEGVVSSDSGDKADKTKPADTALLKQSVASLNKLLQPTQGSIEFSVDEDTGKTLLKVVDTETNTVLLQIPSKQALALSQSIGQTTGVFIKDSA